MMKRIRAYFTVQVYNIGLVSTSVLNSSIKPGDIRWLKHPYKDRFFADPFLWTQDSQSYYLLAEEMCFFEEHGKIVLLTVDKSTFSLLDRSVFIQEPYHLSFPYCEENGEYVIPESIQGGRCMRYHVSVNARKVDGAEEIAKEGIVDPILFNGDESWLLGGRKTSPSGALYEFSWKADQARYTLSSDNSQPIVNSKKHSRNAGRVFTHNGSMYRPAQNCEGRYGHSTILMRIENMPDGEYRESPAMVMTSDGNPPYDQTLHTFNVYDNMILVDGSIDTKQLRNLVYRARKLLSRKLRGLRQ